MTLAAQVERAKFIDLKSFEIFTEMYVFMGGFKLKGKRSLGWMALCNEDLAL